VLWLSFFSREHFKHTRVCFNRAYDGNAFGFSTLVDGPGKEIDLATLTEGGGTGGSGGSGDEEENSREADSGGGGDPEDLAGSDLSSSVDGDAAAPVSDDRRGAGVSFAALGGCFCVGARYIPRKLHTCLNVWWRLGKCLGSSGQ